MERQISIWHTNGKVETVFTSQQLQEVVKGKGEEDFILCFPWMLDEEAPMSLDSALTYLGASATLLSDSWPGAKAPNSEVSDTPQGQLTRKQRKQLRKLANA